MIADRDFAARIARALAAVRVRACVRLATALPPDVTAAPTGDGIAITGRALARRALTDARLRDFAGWLR